MNYNYSHHFESFGTSSITNNHLKTSKSYYNNNKSRASAITGSRFTVFNTRKKIPKRESTIPKYMLVQDSEINNPEKLKKIIKSNFCASVTNSNFYPRTLRSKNYLNELKTVLPPLTIPNNDIQVNNLLKESISNFQNIYSCKGVELTKNIDKMNEGVLNEKSEYEVFKKNEINFDESSLIKNIFKKRANNSNPLVGFKGFETYESPVNALMTLKINKCLMNDMNKAISNYQYQTYANIINEHQKDKIKLCLMPRMTVKNVKYNYSIDNSRNEMKENNKNNLNNNTISKDKLNSINVGKNSRRVGLTIHKELLDKIDKKINANQDNGGKKGKKDKKYKKEKKNNTYEENEEKNKEINKAPIKSTIMRNSLIIEVKNYFCKYPPQNSKYPNSRMEATFTSFCNHIYLFGGLQTSEYNDLWFLDISDKRNTWEKKTIKNENMFNSRYGHSAVLYNDCIYIYGGNINLRRLRNTLEDILVYNISLNTLKSAQFKNEKNVFSQKYIYIPLRRNHIAHVIGWNMIVYGGIDVTKEYSRESYYISNDIPIDKQEQKINYVNKNFVLGDFMALDFISMKWMNLSNIIYKIKGKKNITCVPRVYHSSCLIITQEHLSKGNKLNIYKNVNKLEQEEVHGQTKESLEIRYEGIYIFGGLDENLQETNNLFILHCFRNPLVFFEPKIKGMPPSPRWMCTMNFNHILNFITVYGGKDSLKIFNDLFILDIMNFQWFKIELFGPQIEGGRFGHCSDIIDDKLYIFGGCDDNNKYLSAKVLCIELDLLRNKKFGKIYEFAKYSLEQNPKDRTAKNVMDLLNVGADLPQDIYPFLHLD